MTEVGRLHGHRILVVEDEYLVGESLVQILEDAGATVLGPIGWLEDALDFIRMQDPPPDAAVLDVNLNGQTSYPIADALVEKQIVFMFVTGYDSRALDEAYRGYPRCEKPFQAETVVAALAGLGNNLFPPYES